MAAPSNPRRAPPGRGAGPAAARSSGRSAVASTASPGRSSRCRCSSRRSRSGGPTRFRRPVSRRPSSQAARHELARDFADGSRPRARAATDRGGDSVGARASRADTTSSSRSSVRGRAPRPRASRARQPRGPAAHGRPRALAGSDRRHGGSRQPRHLTGSRPQRLRHGRPDRARPRSLDGHAGAHRSSSSRRTAAPGATSVRRTSPRRRLPRGRPRRRQPRQRRADGASLGSSLRGDDGASPAAALVATADASILAETRAAAPATRAPSYQLLDLAFPFSLYDQAPLLGEGISVPHAHDGRRPAAQARRRRRLGDVDRDARPARTRRSGARPLARRSRRGGERHRVVRLPRRSRAARLRDRVRSSSSPCCRPRRRRSTSVHVCAAASSRWRRPAQPPQPARRLALGRRPGGALRRRSACSRTTRRAAAARHRRGPALAVRRPRRAARDHRARLARRPRTPRSARAGRASDELAGHLAAMLVLCGIAVAVAVTNPYALLFVLPSLHAWLWVPHVRDRRAAGSRAGLCGRFRRPVAAAVRVRRSLRARPRRALVRRDALHRRLRAGALTPLLVLWGASPARSAPSLFGRYAPYPTEDDRPVRGVVRETVRLTVAGSRRLRRSPTGRSRPGSRRSGSRQASGIPFRDRRLRQREVAHGRAGGELTAPARDLDERVRAGRRRRSCANPARRPGAGAHRPSRARARARTNSSRAAFRDTAAARTPVEKAGSGIGKARAAR